MGRSPCCDESRSLKKGPWTREEDQKLVDYIGRHGHGSWSALPKLAGLNRCGKSCRLRWINYLRPDIRRGRFSEEEERIIINLHSVLGNKWSRIASHLPGRTDNEIKNFWNTRIRKKFLQMGNDPITHKPRVDLSQLLNLPQTLYSSPFGNLSTSPFGNNNALKLQTDATQLARIELLQNLLQLMNTSAVIPNVGSYSGALGFDNLNQPFQNVMAQATLQNPGSSPQTTGELEAQINSLSWFEAGLEQFEGPNDHGVISNENSSYSHNIQQECKLPPMVNASCDETPSLSQTDHHFASYETWEKFIDDETSDSYWKKFQDFTSSLSSPIR